MRKLTWFIVLLGLLAPMVMAADAQTADYRADIFAISADGPEVTAKISKLSGVSPYFHLYDVAGKPIEVMANPHLELEFGTGPAAAMTLANKGATVLVGGMAGPKMMDVLDEKKIRFVQRIGTVEDVARELRGE